MYRSHLVRANPESRHGTGQISAPAAPGELGKALETIRAELIAQARPWHPRSRGGRVVARRERPEPAPVSRPPAPQPARPAGSARRARALLAGTLRGSQARVDTILHALDVRRCSEHPTGAGRPGSCDDAEKAACRGGRWAPRDVGRRRRRRDPDAAPGVILAAVDPNRRVLRGHRRGVGDDPQHPAIEPQHEIEDRARVPALEQQKTMASRARAARRARSSSSPRPYDPSRTGR